MEKVFLSRRNLETLLLKLNRKKAGGETMCTLVKHDTVHPIYPQTMNKLTITAVENDDYYCDRPAGIVHPKDDPDV